MASPANNSTKKLFHVISNKRKSFSANFLFLILCTELFLVRDFKGKK